MNEFDITDLPQDAIVVREFEDAATLAQILIKNHNAVLLTREDEFWCVNWVWCENGEANRNDVIFQSKSDYEYHLYTESKKNDNC